MHGDTATMVDRRKSTCDLRFALLGEVKVARAPGVDAVELGAARAAPDGIGLAAGDAL